MKELINLPKQTILDLLIQNQLIIDEITEDLSELYQLTVPDELKDKSLSVKEMLIIIKNHILSNN